jgi:hypothetical protein
VVLVVEDDLLIRLHAAEIVAGARFDVIEAANADRASRIPVQLKATLRQLTVDP